MEEVETVYSDPDSPLLSPRPPISLENQACKVSLGLFVPCFRVMTTILIATGFQPPISNWRIRCVRWGLDCKNDITWMKWDGLGGRAWLRRRTYKCRGISKNMRTGEDEGRAWHGEAYQVYLLWNVYVMRTLVILSARIWEQEREEKMWGLRSCMRALRGYP